MASLAERARLGALVLCLVFACVSAAGAADPIVIGEINPLTGALALQGMAVHQGIVLALEEQNARGGVKGRSLVLLSRDDEGRPERAISAAEEITGRRQAVALIGGYVDSLVGPIAEVADRSRVPYLATASLDERLSGCGNRYFFRISSLAGYVRPMTAAVDIMTPMGRVRFDERGDPVDYERVILQIQSGRHVIVYPIDRATAPIQLPAR